uniref:Uncharacterized protein n=1 Tax=Panagrolaimus sp. ES5 TaxID=591445 RepID=A0AC34F4Q9_9BILA
MTDEEIAAEIARIEQDKRIASVTSYENVPPTFASQQRYLPPQYPSQSYHSTQYPSQPHGPPQYPSEPHGAAKYPSQSYHSTQYPSEPHAAAQYPSQPFAASQYPSQPLDSSYIPTRTFATSQHQAAASQPFAESGHFNHQCRPYQNSNQFASSRSFLPYPFPTTSSPPPGFPAESSNKIPALPPTSASGGVTPIQRLRSASTVATNEPYDDQENIRPASRNTRHSSTTSNVKMAHENTTDYNYQLHLNSNETTIFNQANKNPPKRAQKFGICKAVSKVTAILIGKSSLTATLDDSPLSKIYDIKNLQSFFNDLEPDFTFMVDSEDDNFCESFCDASSNLKLWFSSLRSVTLKGKFNIRSLSILTTATTQSAVTVKLIDVRIDAPDYKLCDWLGNVQQANMITVHSTSFASSNYYDDCVTALEWLKQSTIHPTSFYLFTKGMCEPAALERLITNHIYYLKNNDSISVFTTAPLYKPIYDKLTEIYGYVLGSPMNMTESGIKISTSLCLEENEHASFFYFSESISIANFKMTNSTVKAVHEIIRLLRQYLPQFYGDCGFWVKEKDGTIVQTFQLPIDAPLPDLIDKWMTTTDPAAEKAATETLAAIQKLVNEVSPSTPEAVTAATKKPQQPKKQNTHPTVSDKKVKRPVTSTSFTAIKIASSQVPTPETNVVQPVESALATEGPNESDNMHLQVSNTKTSEPTEKQNYSAEIFRPAHASTKQGINAATVFLIRHIRIYPNYVLIDYENGVHTKVDYSSLPIIMEASSAAPTLSITSCFSISPGNNKQMLVGIFDGAIGCMTDRFWQYCSKVTIDGSYWQGPVLTRIINTFPTSLKSFMMRQFTVIKAYRMRWSLGSNTTNLQQFNYDCRVTDNTDFFNNVKFLEHFNNHTLKSLFLNVTGFPASYSFFLQMQRILQKIMTKNGNATILTEEPIDDIIYDLLLSFYYDYVGTGTSQSAFEPFYLKTYDLFNVILEDDVLITIGCLQREL